MRLAAFALTLAMAMSGCTAPVDGTQPDAVVRTSYGTGADEPFFQAELNGSLVLGARIKVEPGSHCIVFVAARAEVTDHPAYRFRALAGDEFLSAQSASRWHLVNAHAGPVSSEPIVWGVLHGPVYNKVIPSVWMWNQESEIELDVGDATTLDIRMTFFKAETITVDFECDAPYSFLGFEAGRDVVPFGSLNGTATGVGADGGVVYANAGESISFEATMPSVELLVAPSQRGAAIYEFETPEESGEYRTLPEDEFRWTWKHGGAGHWGFRYTEAGGFFGTEGAISAAGPVSSWHAFLGLPVGESNRLA